MASENPPDENIPIDPPENAAPTEPPINPGASPDTVAGRSIVLPESKAPAPELARAPSQVPAHVAAAAGKGGKPAFDPRVLVPLDLLDPVVPSARQLEERLKVERAIRKRMFIGIGGGLGGGLVLALIGGLVYQRMNAAPPPQFDDGIVIAVDSEPPGATVFLDGRSTGEVTPTHLKNWDFSTPHHVRLELKGFFPDDHLVDANPHPHDIVAKLPRIAHLSMRSTPLGATLSMDGKDVGGTPAVFDVPAGRDVEIKVNLAGYLPVSEHVLLQADETVLREVTLHAMSILAVRTEPPGVRCSVDGQPDVTTPADFSLAADVPHKVHLVAGKLPPQDRTVKLKEGKRQELKLRFEDGQDRRLRARIEALNRQSAASQRKLDALQRKGSNNGMFETFGRLKSEDKLSDAVDKADSQAQELSDELNQHQLELEDQLKADNLKNDVPPGKVFPIADPAAKSGEEDQE